MSTAIFSRGFIRAPARTSPKAFPIWCRRCGCPVRSTANCWCWRDGRVQTFNVLQQRLNRKSVTPKLMKDYPIHLRTYDLLSDGENDLRMLTFTERRAKLEKIHRRP